MNDDYRALQQAVCAGMGWCGSVINGQARHVSQLIPKSGVVTADNFVDWLFEAEGYDALTGGHAKQHRRSIKRAFIEHMGGDSVDASRLR